MHILRLERVPLTVLKALLPYPLAPLVAGDLSVTCGDLLVGLVSVFPSGCIWYPHFPPSMLRFHDDVFRWDDCYPFIELLMDFHLESHAHHLQIILKYAVLSAVSSV